VLICHPQAHGIRNNAIKNELVPKSIWQSGASGLADTDQQIDHNIDQYGQRTNIRKFL